jgi:hypothetical protein
MAEVVLFPSSAIIAALVPDLHRADSSPGGAEQPGGGRVAGVFQVPKTELRRRRSRHGRARSVFMEFCRLCLARKKGLAGEIGRELGGVSVSALSQNRARLATRMKRDPSLKEHFERLRDAFNQNPRLE